MSRAEWLTAAVELEQAARQSADCCDRIGAIAERMAENDRQVIAAFVGLLEGLDKIIGAQS